MSNRADRRRLARAHDKALTASGKDPKAPKLAWQIATTVDGRLDRLQDAEAQLRKALFAELGDKLAGRPVVLKTYAGAKIDQLLERFRVAGFGDAPAIREIPSWVEEHPQARVVVAFVEIPPEEQP